MPETAEERAFRCSFGRWAPDRPRLGARFSGEERHQRRLDKVLAIESAERG